MTDTQYVPTTDEVRNRASRDAARFGFLQELDFERQFDAWLAAHDAQVAEKAVKALADLAAVFDEIDGRGWIPGCETFSDPDGYCRVCTARQNAEQVLIHAETETPHA